MRSHAAVEERVGNDPISELWGEHRARYRFAVAQGLAGRRVLDVACGAGFGSAMLGAAGARAVAMDLDPVAVGEARRTAAGVPLARADALHLPLRGQSVDAVVSFETLEHVPDASMLVRELARVLRPDGQVILSTPNLAFGPPERHTQNPFHVREFTAAELRALLSAHFRDVTLYGQWVHPSYRYVPYLLVRSTWQPREVVWKLQNRLPFAVKDGLARLISGRPYFPSEEDYLFRREDSHGAHALVATARGPRP